MRGSAAAGLLIAVTIMLFGGAAGCGRRGAPAPAQAAPTVVLERAAWAGGALEVALSVEGAAGFRAERAEVALWREGSVVATAEAGASLVVRFPVAEAEAEAAAEAEAEVPGEPFRLTGSVYGSYWPGQREIFYLDLHGEVRP